MTGQADTAKIEITREALSRLSSRFELAYASWRERLLDQSWDGVPWAEANGEGLFQEFLSAIEGHERC